MDAARSDAIFALLRASHPAYCCGDIVMMAAISGSHFGHEQFDLHVFIVVSIGYGSWARSGRLIAPLAVSSPHADQPKPASRNPEHPLQSALSVTQITQNQESRRGSKKNGF
jgi:hypothetical protein